MSQSTIFQLCRDGSFWVEPVLSSDQYVLLKDTSQGGQWGSNLQLLDHESSTLPLSYCAPVCKDKNNLQGLKYILIWKL